MTVGSHSSLSVEFMMLSIARFRTSIPADMTTFRSLTGDSHANLLVLFVFLPIARDTGRFPMYWTWNFWTCCRTASRNSTKMQQGGGISTEAMREKQIRRPRSSHLVWVGLQVRCSPWSGSVTASSLTSLTSSEGHNYRDVSKKNNIVPQLSPNSC